MFTPGLPEQQGNWIWEVCGALGLVLIGLVLLLERQPQLTHHNRLLAWLYKRLPRFTKRPTKHQDSQRFQQALLIWREVVACKSTAPRSLKAFKNRARYFVTLAEELLPQAVDETHWLALAAIHYVEPELLNFEPLYSDNIGVTPLTSVTADFTPEAAAKRQRQEELIKQAITTHQQQHGSWPPSPQNRELFAWLAEGMKIH
ncbi:hypothetical protein KEF85_04850 [Methylomonas paludis]|uniref:Uncharacterized protein n=1 Tax=Methylomonas paludis TaxID=1173101 RepID=A0A975MQA6_9GAMM|nr:hypothetical protein [Methylomonas paludis]QWF71804.1 hypothetical protein KEF85_04850 [Methylomonas paludis]